jgi:HEAT repeat protein
MNGTCNQLPSGATGDLTYTRKLMEGLWNPLPDVAEMCAWSLGQLRDPIAVPSLCEVVRERTDLDAVRVAAIHALREIGDTSAVPTFVAAAQNGHIAVRLAAIEALSDPALGATAINDLHDLASAEPSPRLRGQIEQALRSLSNSQNSEDLHER